MGSIPYFSATNRVRMETNDHPEHVVVLVTSSKSKKYRKLLSREINTSDIQR
jgi:hypothetical protein